MEAAVEVALPASVDSARLAGSPEGFGSGGVLVGDVRLQTDGACSSGGKNDNNHAVNISELRQKVPDPEICWDIVPTPSLHCNDVVKEPDYGNINSHLPTLDLDAKPVLTKSGKIIRKNNGCNKRSGMVYMDVLKPKPGPCDVKNGSFLDLASLNASCNVSEKIQAVKLKNSSTSRHGDRRNSKANCKSRSDLFSTKNGLVGFNSAARGNYFIGGVKSDVFEISKYVDEPPLDELLHGSYSCSLIKDKVKTTSNSNNILLQSVRNACSILQARKVSQAQTSGVSLVRKDSACLDAVIPAVNQTVASKQVNSAADLPSSEKVQESHNKAKTSDTPLYKPRVMLERLALSIPKDLYILLADASKTTLTSKNSTDTHLGKAVSQRMGLPSFPWSHSFSGHNNKLGSDAVKLSASRTICQGRWVRVKNCTALQEGCTDLLKNFDSLTFDQSLVPIVSDCPDNEAAPVERFFSPSDASSTTKTPTDEYSTNAAAQTLLDMAAFSKNNPLAPVRKSSQRALKASKPKSIKRPKNPFQGPEPTIRPLNPLKAHNDGFSSKKPKLSAYVTNSPYIITQAKSLRRGTSLISSRPILSCIGKITD